jgi:hypothetical protein
VKLSTTNLMWNENHFILQGANLEERKKMMDKFIKKNKLQNLCCILLLLMTINKEKNKKNTK